MLDLRKLAGSNRKGAARFSRLVREPEGGATKLKPIREDSLMNQFAYAVRRGFGWPVMAGCIVGILGLAALPRAQAS